MGADKHNVCMYVLSWFPDRIGFCHLRDINRKLPLTVMTLHGCLADPLLYSTKLTRATPWDPPGPKARANVSFPLGRAVSRARSTSLLVLSPMPPVGPHPPFRGTA